MDHPISRTIEKATGIGKLYQNGLFLDDVTYFYTINQRFLIVESSSGREELPGVKSLEGYVILQGVYKDILGDDNFTLETRDQQKFPVLFYTGDFLSKQYFFKRAAR